MDDNKYGLRYRCCDCNKGFMKALWSTFCPHCHSRYWKEVEKSEPVDDRTNTRAKGRPLRDG